MNQLSDFILCTVFGPNASQGISAIKTGLNLPALAHLVNVISSIESGSRVAITDREITLGLDELKGILDFWTDQRKDLNQLQKESVKLGNSYVVTGCYKDIMAMLQRLCYSCVYS